jgi:hypothetical protein
VKRTRRVSVEIEHREISIFLTLSESRADGQTPAPSDSGPVPGACSICGAPWVFVTPKAGAPLGAHIEQVLAAFLQRGLHPPIFAGGLFLICRRSFDQLNERL